MINQTDAEEQNDPNATPAIGEVIAGKYRVESVVGSGGMGVVLGAIHLELGQSVAIKVLTVPDDDSRKDEARERFLREGRATAALVSDHVVRVYDVGTLENGAPFMVMELLRGQDLAHTLQQNGTFAIELACDCVRQAADAIASAHARGIVHRDLKPSNLFLTQRSDGGALVKVLDFGISKSTSVELERSAGDLTVERSVLGTPFYMSPEQVRDAKSVDFRSDIWSLGLILHELLSGSPAFEGRTLPGLCAAIAADPPAALRLKRPEVPVEVEAIVLKCLEKDPGKRFQSARELFEQLSPWTGRAESGLLSPERAAKVTRSALSGALSELRTGSTVQSTPPDTGTLASAVFTKSGAGEAATPRAAHSEFVTTERPAEAAPSPSPSPSPTSGKRGGAKRSLLTVGISGLLLMGGLVWVFRGYPNAAQTVAPPPTNQPPVPPRVTPTNPAFSLQIASNPIGASVVEGEQALGTTPLSIQIDPASVARSPRTFTVRKAGYAPYTLVQGASAKDLRVLADLAPEPSPAQPRPAPSTIARAPSVTTPAAKKPAPPHQVASQPTPPSGDIFMQR